MVNKSHVWFLYIIRDKYNRLYTGISNDVQKRFTAHNEGRGAKFLRGANPLTLVFCSVPLSKTQAAQYEYKVKKLNKKTKEKIISEKTDITQFFN